AKPHWLLGNLLLRMGQTEDAFREFRAANSSDFTYLPPVIDLAWGIYQHDVKLTLAAIQPHNDKARAALAIFFAAHKEGAASLEQFGQMTSFSGQKSEDLLRELLRARLFTEAFEVWRLSEGKSAKIGYLVDPSFEDPIVLGQAGFGWALAADTPNATMSVDTSVYQSGTHSLRVDFHGESNPEAPLVS